MTNIHHENIVSNMNTGVRFWNSKVDTNGYVPFHWHDSIEINCTLSGRLTYRLGGKVFVTSPNEFIVVPSGVVHDVANTPNHGLALQVPTRIVEPYFHHPEEATFLNGHKEIKEYPLVVQLIKALDQNNRSQAAGYQFDNGILLLQLLKILFTKFRSQKVNMPIKEGIKECIIYINAHYNQQLTVADLAHHFGYNSSYLSRLFKEQTGISLINYIYEIRINRFYAGLTQTNRPISELLRQNGLRNERTERLKFKEMFGKLPNEVRG